MDYACADIFLRAFVPQRAFLDVDFCDLRILQTYCREDEPGVGVSGSPGTDGRTGVLLSAQDRGR